MLKWMVVKIQTYLHSLFNTFSSPRYYLDVLNTRFSFSVRFFIISYALLSLISTGLFWSVSLPKFQQQVKVNLAQAIQSYPQDLVISWDKNHLQTNSSTPIEVPYPSFLRQSNLPNSFGYIAPQVTQISDIKSVLPQSSLFVVGERELYLATAQGGWSAKPLNQMVGFDESFTIDQETAPLLISDAMLFFNELAGVVKVVYPVFIFLFLLVTRTISLMISSLLLYFMYRLLQRPFTFRKTLQLSLHIAVVAELVHIITSQFFPMSSLDMFSITYWVYALIISAVLWNLRSIPTIRMR
jgi:hypothetical protein